MTARQDIVRRTGNRFSANAVSAISTRGRMHFMVFIESFDAQVICRFLARLTGYFDRRVRLVVDRHSAHRSKAVRDWLADDKDQVELHFLPSYSPALNPDELLNAHLKAVRLTPTGPGARPNSPPRHAGSSTVDNASPASRADTSAVDTSTTSSTSELG
ncbi:transposase [Streptomyces sp. ACT015]|uniref:transposase n=1 Tax=Streptomyces sp. ACT015 TaxID=3134807 RepID=UPI003D17A3AC